jgi:catechol 1,2-dioxygenase
MERATTADDITAEVIRRLEATPNPRLREITMSLVSHLHAFVKDVELTEAEWFEGIRFLTDTGHMCDDKRQEFILLSDTLGVSMVVDLITHRRRDGATESTVFGPFHPIAGALLDVWQTDSAGLYDSQTATPADLHMRGTFRTNEDGRYLIRTVRPVHYQIPSDGPAGRLLRATGRHPWRPAHIHFVVSAAGYESVTTHIFDAIDPYLKSDAVFAVKDSLICEFVEHTVDDEDARRLGAAAPFCMARFDFVLQRA